MIEVIRRIKKKKSINYGWVLAVLFLCAFLLIGATGCGETFRFASYAG